MDTKVFTLITSQLSGHVGYLWTLRFSHLVTSQLSGHVGYQWTLRFSH